MRHHAVFTITGEFITDISRQLWAEGRPEAGLRILESAFPDMPPDMRMAVAMGFKRLDGDSNVGVTVHDDSTDVEPSEMLSSVLEPYRREIDKLKDEVEFCSGQTVSIPSPHGLIKVPRRRTVRKVVKCIPQRVLDGDWDLLNHIPWSHVFAEDREEEFNSPATRLERAERLGDECLPPPPEIPKPPPPGKKTIDQDNGWLAPDGTFFGCFYGGHITLADQLGHDSKAIEEAGWIKIQEGDAWSLRSITVGDPEPTQKQLDRLFDWYRERDKEMPRWMAPDDEDYDD